MFVTFLQDTHQSIEPAEVYLKTFHWNKVKYRADKPIGEIVDTLQKETTSIDNDVKNKYNQYNQVKTQLTVLQRKQTGNLSNKSLTAIVDPSLIIQDSEYLETHIVAIPKNLVKDFLKTYETISSMIVPRSAVEIDRDDEFRLYAVTTFKKHSNDFIHKCRENKWTPRDFKYKEGGREEERKEVEKVGKEERKVWGEALRLGRTAWGEAVMAWMHVLALRVFVETVLRYGLPLSFVCGLVRVELNDTIRSALPMLTKGRRVPLRLSRKRVPLLTPRIHTSAAMRLDETRRVESQRMTPRLRRRCKQLGTWEMEETIRHTCATSLRFNRDSTSISEMNGASCMTDFSLLSLPLIAFSPSASP